MQRLKDGIAIVTGGSKGLGREFSTALAHQGAKVVIADIADDDGLAAKLGGMFISADISEPQAAHSVANSCHQEFGAPNILVNNAAIYAQLKMQTYDQISPELWDRVMAVNVKGAFNMVQATAPYMEAAGQGKIINITSGTVYKGCKRHSEMSPLAQTRNVTSEAER